MAFRTEDLDYLYSALSHEIRRSMIRHLGQEGVLSFTELMEKSGVKETVTFGFHLKRTEPLLEKLTDGRYKLTPLGQTAHRILRFTDMSEEEQAKAFQPREELEVEAKPRQKGVSLISDIKRLLLNKDRLERYDKVIVEDCYEVIIDNDVDPETFKSKILAFRDVRRIVAPRNLYKLVLSRVEEGVGDVEQYEGEPPLEALQRRLYNYSESIVDCSKLEPGTKICNYSILTLRNVTVENLKRISLQENFGVIKVPRGFKEPVLMMLKPEKNYGRIEEY